MEEKEREVVLFTMSVPQRCLVTGGSGFVGQRLSEMLLERGAQKVVSFDIHGK